MREGLRISGSFLERGESCIRTVCAGLVLACLLCSMGCAVRLGEDAARQGEEMETAENPEVDFPNALDVAVADFDKDGLLDFVVGYAEAVFLYSGRPAGREVYKQKICDARSVGRVMARFVSNLQLKTGDLDQDGDEDLVVSDVDGARVFWNDGHGWLAPSGP